MTEYILGFEITMKKPILMKERQPTGNFIKYDFDFTFSQCPLGLIGPNIDLIQIGFNKIKDEIQLIIGQNDLLQFNQIGMIHFL